MADYQILSDATLDLTDDMLETLDVTIIPMIVEMDGTDYTICGKDSTIGIMEFYAKLEQGAVARTSQVTANTYYQYIEEEFKKGRDALVISFSSALSKGFEASLMCAERIRADYPDRKVYCLDSLCAAGGHTALVEAAVRKQKEGMNIDELAAWIEDVKMNVDQWFTVDELDTLLRGGRVSKASAVVGTMLSIKPVIHINRTGALIPVNKVRGRKKSLELVASEFKNSWNGGDELVVIGHGTDFDSANLLKDMILAESPTANVKLIPIGTVIAAHTGPTVVGAFFFGKQARRDSK
ncbi:MAG: DegV family protein [Clostridiales bacterium]|nr:DegV family protein [Clostridiales bacterium]